MCQDPSQAWDVEEVVTGPELLTHQQPGRSWISVKCRAWCSRLAGGGGGVQVHISNKHHVMIMAGG
jgi:hypothetical protein